MIVTIGLIIPLREKIGNYDVLKRPLLINIIIPLREKIGNYDPLLVLVRLLHHYTTTRENWELRPTAIRNFEHADYTTTRENWELRPNKLIFIFGKNYTTTRENWELRQSYYRIYVRA